MSIMGREFHIFGSGSHHRDRTKIAFPAAVIGSFAGGIIIGRRTINRKAA